MPLEKMCICVDDDDEVVCCTLGESEIAFVFVWQKRLRDESWKAFGARTVGPSG